MADNDFAALDFLHAVRRHLTLITRLRLDAHLVAPPPPRRPGQRGRPRRKGERLPTLAQRLTRADTAWRRITLTDWYGKGPHTVEIASDTALWYQPGAPLLPLRWVLVRDPARRFKPQALLGTTLTDTPEQILAWFVLRWRLEVTFEEARRHLGIETQRQWSDAAIERTTPVLMGLFSLITLWANQMFAQTPHAPRQAAWYAKANLTFSDALAAVRHRLWQDQISVTSTSDNNRVEIPRELFQRLTDTLCYAA